jgi:hypothetical protein
MERRAALEMDVQARAKAMADTKRAAERGLVKERQLCQSGSGIVGVVSAKERRRMEREQSGRVRRRMGI